MALKIRRSINDVVEIENLSENTTISSAIVTQTDVKAALEDIRGDFDVHNHDSVYVKSSLLGAASGVATLDAGGLVPASQLPSYVDDILEGTLATFPATGEGGKIYVDTVTNLQYRWSGSAYSVISSSLALGENSSTAYAGDKGKATTDSLNTHLANTSNPHEVTKAQVGLGSVPNVTTNNQVPTFTAAGTRANIASGETLTTTLGKLSKWYTDLKTVAFSGSYNDLSDKPITAATITDLTDGGDTSLHYHSTDRDRANHTGTQTASTISDFAATVRSVALTGLSTATNAVITATDTVLVALGKLQAQISSVAANLGSHTSNTSNPHTVTKTQVGLGNVPNVATNDQAPTYTQAASNADLESGEAMSTAFGKISKAINSLILHLANTSNPHAVTKAQLGVDNVPNVTTNNQVPTFTMAAANADLTSGETLTLSLGKISKAINSLISHLGNTSNPHTVTKAQVGLGSADNTSDVNKPVSTAQQTALNLKLDASEVVTTASASKVLKLDANSKLPASITGNADGNAATATKLATARAISVSGDATGTASFDGSANAGIAVTLANSGATAGTYKSVTVDVKGRVTAGTNPTTLAGYGITDAAPSSHVGTGGASHAAVTTTVNGFMLATDKVKLDGVATGANNYAHPTGDGNLHVPATGTANSAKVLTAGATAGSLSWTTNTPDWSNITNKPTSTVANIDTAVTNTHTHGNKSVLDATTASFLTADETKLDGIEALADVTDATNVGTALHGTAAKTTVVDADTVGIIDSAASNVLSKITFANLKASIKTYTDTLYNNYAHPNHTGEVTSAGGGAQTITNNAVTNAKLAQVATGIIKGRATAATGNVEDLTAAQVRTIINVADGANNYAHPSGDGNLHVPATSTTNNGKVLTAGASAGSLSWVTPTVYSLPVAGVSLGGVKSGTDITVDASGNVSVNDDSHNHVIANVDGLQTALNNKIETSLINNALSTGTLWTSDKIVSYLDTNLPIECYQYEGTVTANTTIQITIPTAVDYKSNNVEILTYRNSRWEKAIHGIDYGYWFSSQTTLEVEFFEAGTYKVNYVYAATGSLSWTIVNATEPTNQSLNDFWLETL